MVWKAAAGGWFLPIWFLLAPRVGHAPIEVLGFLTWRSGATLVLVRRCRSHGNLLLEWILVQ